MRAKSRWLPWWRRDVWGGNRDSTGHLLYAREVALAFGYLASGEAAWVTRSELVIDGGMTAQ